ncbi:MAG: T9SS C-terminal target domain-containing protein, partial [Chitinophagia bacterium]|nr:T9SS C-terminal target domain-containing protein [Chitinophagia bacterium]
GTWSTSDATVASVDATGFVTSVSVGTATISYTIANSCGANSATAAFTVRAVPAAAINSAVVPCIGYATSVVFTGTAGDTVTFTIDGGAPNNGVLTAGTYSYPIASLTASHSYRLTRVSNGICATTIDTTVILNPAQMSWTGTTDTNWNNSANWSCGSVPLVTDNVTIHAGTLFAPKVLAAASAHANSLSVDSSVVITLDSAATLDVKATFDLRGVINGRGLVILNGSAPQSITGRGRVGDITLSNAGGVRIDSGSKLTVMGALALTTGNLTTNDSLVLGADTVSTSRLAPLPVGSAIIGRAKAMQTIQGGYRRYRFMGHPFADTLSLAPWQQTIDITGTRGATNGFTPTATNAASAYRYNTLNGNSDLSYDPGWATFTNALPSASDSNKVHRYQGFRIFIRGAKGEGLGYGSYYPSATVVGQYGTLNQGTQYVTVARGATASQAYNLLANPYPSPVDLGSVLWEAKRTGKIFGSFYVWNPALGTGGQFSTLPIDTSSPAVPYVIQEGAAFEVRAMHNGDTIIFNESNKSVLPTTQLLRTNTGYTSLNIYDANYHLWDMLQVKFSDNATDEQDLTNDADKLIGGDLNFYSLSADGKRQAIDVRSYGADKVIPLGITSNYAQDFIIRADQVALPENGTLYLHDKFLNTYTALTDGAEYRFSITKDAATQGNGRFELKTAPAAVTSAQVLTVNLTPNPATDQVVVSFAGAAADKVSVRVTDLNGVQVLAQTVTTTGAGKVNLPARNLAAGVYLVELTDGNTTQVHRLVKE